MTRSKIPDTRAHRSDKPVGNDSREASQVSNAGQTLTTPAVTRTQSETRLIAIRLQDAPPPFFSKKQLEHRWQIGPDTVRKLLLKESIDPGPKKGLLISLFDILHLEAVNDPLGLWVTFAARGMNSHNADRAASRGIFANVRFQQISRPRTS
jgi:hypothetical protein